MSSVFQLVVCSEARGDTTIFASHDLDKVSDIRCALKHLVYRRIKEYSTTYENGGFEYDRTNIIHYIAGEIYAYFDVIVRVDEIQMDKISLNQHDCAEYAVWSLKDTPEDLPEWLLHKKLEIFENHC